ncbi:MAG: phosphoadenosine phosphosulfate reductase family protein, partial [Candidatus Omnitrophica bacterium]|nr:phosphoadenosine phosphosulfate reductase family protein [Candidatus Omnitrophota bacterium]
MGLLEMGLSQTKEEITELVDKLNFKEKVDRSLALIKEAYEKYGDGLVVANSLGKDSVCVWNLAKRVGPKIRGFIVTTRFKPKETVQFMQEMVARYPELKIYKSDAEIPD